MQISNHLIVDQMYWVHGFTCMLVFEEMFNAFATRWGFLMDFCFHTFFKKVKIATSSFCTLSGSYSLRPQKKNTALTYQEVKWFQV